jgi:hypothetical protein
LAFRFAKRDFRRPSAPSELDCQQQLESFNVACAQLDLRPPVIVVTNPRVKVPGSSMLARTSKVSA